MSWKATPVAIAVLAALNLTASPLLAQNAPPLPVSTIGTETVTVNGTRTVPANTVDRFVKNYAAPTFFLGKLARWNEAICYKISGLQPEPTAFIQQRLVAVASMVRVKSDARANCRVNAEIVFTPKPQAFMDDIRKNIPSMLGTHDDSPSKAEQIATVKRPIQAWYATQIRDAKGNVQPEMNYLQCMEKKGGTATVSLYIDPRTGLIRKDGVEQLERNLNLCGDTYKASLLSDGISAEFANVLVVADTNKLSNIPLAPLADYIAMLVLASAQPSDACQELPTIANLLAEGCEAKDKPSAMTDVDIAYLKALYAMEPDLNPGRDLADIASRMKTALNGH